MGEIINRQLRPVNLKGLPVGGKSRNAGKMMLGVPGKTGGFLAAAFDFGGESNRIVEGRLEEGDQRVLPIEGGLDEE